jgi:membrane protein implicated in regulation of membrane protease activity
MRVWFWAWLVVAAAIAAASAVARDRGSAPFAAGALAAATLEALGASPGWEWIAFLTVSCALFVAFNRACYRRRHGHSTLGRHSAERAVERD